MTVSGGQEVKGAAQPVRLGGSSRADHLAFLIVADMRAQAGRTAEGRVVAVSGDDRGRSPCSAAIWGSMACSTKSESFEGRDGWSDGCLDRVPLLLTVASGLSLSCRACCRTFPFGGLLALGDDPFC
jgi:hypothetical protein